MKFKKTLAGTLACALTITAGLVPAGKNAAGSISNAVITASAEDFVRGDTNGSGELDLHDVIEIAESLLKSKDPLTGEAFERADFNMDGKVNLYDAIGIGKEIVAGDVNVKGNTPANGGITIESTHVYPGTLSVNIPFYIDEGIKSQGCIVKYIVPDGFTCSYSSCIAYNYDNGTGMYVNPTGYDNEEPIGSLGIELPADLEEGEYTISAEILALDDANGGYYANPTVTAGTLTVSSQEPTPGLRAESKSVSYGTEQTEIDIYGVDIADLDISGCQMNIEVDSPLYIKDFKSDYNLDHGQSEISVYTPNVFSAKKPVCKAIIGIEPNAEPGTYPVNISVKSILSYYNSEYAGPDTPVINGSITIKKPSEGPVETTVTTAPENPESTTTITTITDANGKIYGDVNNSGGLDIHDVLMITDHILAFNILNEAQEDIADINRDGKANIRDAVAISNIILNIEPEIKDTTPAKGGINIGSTEIYKGEKWLNLPVYFDDSIKTKGCIVKFNLPKGMAMLSPGNATASDDEEGKCVFILSTGNEPGESFTNLDIYVSPYIQLGEYIITAEIIALDNAEGGYYANPTVTAGIVTVKELEVPQPEAWVMWLEDAYVPYGTKQVELGMHMSIDSSKGCKVLVETDHSGFKVADFKGSMMCDSSEAVYASGDYLPTDEPFGHVVLDIDESVEPGMYVVYLIPISVDNNGTDIDNPATAIGYITIEAPDEPIEPGPDEETVYSGYNFDTDEQGIGVESAIVPYGTETVELGLYMLNLDAKGCEISADDVSPLYTEAFSGCMAFEYPSAVYVTGDAYKSGEQFGKMVINIASGAEPGTYPVNLIIHKLGDADGNYVTDPVAVSGYIIIKDPNDPSDTDPTFPTDPTVPKPNEKPVYSGYNFDTDKQGIGVESVTVPYGTKQVELGLYMLNLDAKGCIIDSDVAAPLYNSDYSGSMSSAPPAAVYVTGDVYKSGEQFGKIVIDIASDAKPGTYPVNLIIDKLGDADGNYVTDPVAVSGYITIKGTSETPADPAKGIKVPEGAVASMYGDINNDETVNVADVVAVNLFILNSTKNALTDKCIANADCVKDGFINSSDSIRLMNYVAEIIGIEYLGV